MSADHDYGVPIPGRVLPQEAWARTAIKRLPPPGPLDWKAIFDRPTQRADRSSAAVVLDIGCGNGRFVIASALARPEVDHLGIEILPVVIRYATRRANQRGLSNVRLAVIGGYEFLAQYAAPASLAEIHLYHPQPWKAERKATRSVSEGVTSTRRASEGVHRRLITPEFLALAHRSLALGGLLVLQTDNRAYWKYIRRVLPLFFEFEELKGRWPDAPQGRTRREIYARQHGLPIFRGQARPRPELTAEAIERFVREAPRPDFQA